MSRFRTEVYALLSPSTLVVGSDLLAGQLSVRLPEGFLRLGLNKGLKQKVEDQQKLMNIDDFM